MRDATDARRGLFLYFSLVLLGTGVCQLLLIRTGEPITKHGALVMLLMWTPGLASIITRIVRREGFVDVSFGIRGPRVAAMLGLAWIYPVIVGGLGYGAAWITHLATFAAPEKSSIGLEHAHPALRFAVSLGLNLTIGTLLSMISAAGEELGWRGYMVPRLLDARVPRPLFVSGIVWSAWHVPLIVTGQYAAGPRPVLSAALFMMSITAASYVAARLRLESGSLWPAVMFHAAWNAVIQGSFDKYTLGGDAARTTSIWIGESGVLVVAADVLVALYVVRRAWPVRWNPRAVPTTTIGLSHG